MSSRTNAHLEVKEILVGKEVSKIVITDTKEAAITHTYFDILIITD